MSKNISKLKKELKNLRKQRESAVVKVLYHQNQIKKFKDVKDEKKLDKHTRKKQNYERMLENIRREVEVLKAQIVLAEDQERKKEYNKILKGFYLEITELLTTFKDTLESKDYNEAYKIIQDIKEFYGDRAKEINIDDLTPFTKYLNLEPIPKILLNIINTNTRILEVNRVYSTQASAGLREKVANWSKNLLGQIDSCLVQIKDILKRL